MAPSKIEMETLMEGRNNGTTAVFLTTRPGNRCPPKSSAMAISVTESADGEALQDKDSVVVPTLLDGARGLVSETPSEPSLRLDGEALFAHLNLLDVTVNFMPAETLVPLRVNVTHTMHRNSLAASITRRKQ